MRLIRKNVIRFEAVPYGEAKPALVEIRIEPDRFGTWQARATMRVSADAPPTALTRTFRGSDHGIAAGKMVAWIRGRYARARSVPDRAHSDKKKGAESWQRRETTSRTAPAA